MKIQIGIDYLQIFLVVFFFLDDACVSIAPLPVAISRCILAGKKGRDYKSISPNSKMKSHTKCTGDKDYD